MKKLLMLALVLVTSMSFAQNAKFGLDVGLEAAMPMGDFGDIAGFGIGGTLKGSYPINEKMSATLRTGYIMFTEGADILPGFSYTISEVPIMAGINYKMTPEFYGMAEIGMTMLGMESEYKHPLTGTTITSDTGDSYMSYGIGAGYMMNAFDFCLSYNSVVSEGDACNNIGLRVGYKFM